MGCGLQAGRATAAHSFSSSFIFLLLLSSLLVSLTLRVHMAAPSSSTDGSVPLVGSGWIHCGLAIRCGWSSCVCARALDRGAERGSDGGASSGNGGGDLARIGRGQGGGLGFVAVRAERRQSHGGCEQSHDGEEGKNDERGACVHWARPWHGGTRLAARIGGSRQGRWPTATCACAVRTMSEVVAAAAGMLCTQGKGEARQRGVRNKGLGSAALGHGPGHGRPWNEGACSMARLRCAQGAATA